MVLLRKVAEFGFPNCWVVAIMAPSRAGVIADVTAIQPEAWHSAFDTHASFAIGFEALQKIKFFGT